MNCLIASSVCGLVGLCGIDVEEMAEARLPVELDGIAVGADISISQETADMGIGWRVGVNMLQIPANTKSALFADTR